MVWCSSCGRDQPVDVDYAKGFVCCTGCGKVIDDNIYSEETTFTKLADGTSQAVGSVVTEGSIGGSLSKLGGAMSGKFGFRSDSHEQTLKKGTNAIYDIAERLSIRPLNDSVNAAKRLYQLGLQRRFTTGRRVMHVAAACLYIVCRQEKKPYLLIDFSDVLQTNVFVLGAVFVQLCKVLHLEQHPILQTPVDPSLFIHRYTHQLEFGKKAHAVSETALRLVASMKRDWIQTGRKPGGICGAALFISAHVHGFHTTKKQIVSIVHVSESTLQYRLFEFENTPSGCLTVQEFEDHAKDYENQRRQGIDSDMVMAQLNRSLLINMDGNPNEQVLCNHKDVPCFAFGLCKECFNRFMEVSGGIFSGEMPPAFIKSEKKRKEMEREKEDGKTDEDGQARKLQNVQKTSEPSLLDPSSTNSTSSFRENESSRSKENEGGLEEGVCEPSFSVDPLSTLLSLGDEDENELQVSYLDSQLNENLGGSIDQNPNENKDHYANANGNVFVADVCETVDEFLNEKDDASESLKVGKIESNVFEKDKDQGKTTAWEEKIEVRVEEEEDKFSDIDDAEVDAYFLDEKEVKIKTWIWESMNKDYMEKLEIQRQAEQAQEALRNSLFDFDDPDKVSSMDPAALAAAAAAAIAAGKAKKPRKARKKSTEKGPAESAMESAQRMMEKKKMSTKINYSALENLFGKPSDKSMKNEEENGKKEYENDDVPDEEKYNDASQVDNILKLSVSLKDTKDERLIEPWNNYTEINPNDQGNVTNANDQEFSNGYGENDG